MSRNNLLTLKSTGMSYLLNKTQTNTYNKNQPITHRQPKRDSQSSNKLYTFCASQNKPPNQQQTTRQQPKKQRKVSINGVKGRISDNINKSKGKYGTPMGANKQRQKSSRNILQLNNTFSSVGERQKTQKSTTRELDKKINISICINKSRLNQDQFSESGSYVNILKERTNTMQQMNRSRQKSVNKDNNNGKQSNKTIIAMSEDELTLFAQKFAAQKVKLQENIQRLNRRIKDMEVRQAQWQYFKKDSQEYITFLEGQRNKAQRKCQQVQKRYADIEKKNVENQKKYSEIQKKYVEIQKRYVEIQKRYKQVQRQKSVLKDQKQYLNIAKDEFQNRLKQIQQQNKRLLQKKSASLSCHSTRGCQNCLDLKTQKQLMLRQMGKMLKMLQIQNSHLKKQNKMLEQHTSDKHSKQNIVHTIQGLKTANMVLNQQLKKMYVYKIQSQVYQKTLHSATLKIQQLTLQNTGIQQNVNIFNHRQAVSAQFQSLSIQPTNTRMDSSAHAAGDAQMRWKCDHPQNSIEQFYTNRQAVTVREYFDYDFCFHSNSQSHK